MAYERIRGLFHHVSLEHYPNVIASAKDLSGGNSGHELQLISYAKICVAHAYEYFIDKDLKPILDIFAAARKSRNLIQLNLT